MANIRKSFNFRTGLQVDNDNFVVNANGLVGIGTSIPQIYKLSIEGDNALNVSGLSTLGTVYATGVSTFSNNLNVGSNITFDSSTGTVNATTFSGSASGLTDIYAIAVDGWYVDSGNSNIGTAFNVGAGTTEPEHKLHVVGDAKVSGILTAGGFSGFGTGITDIPKTSVGATDANTAGAVVHRDSEGGFSAGIITATLSGIATTALNLSDAANITTGTISTDRLTGSYDIGITGSVVGSSSTVGVGTVVADNEIRVGTGITLDSAGMRLAGITTIGSTSTIELKTSDLDNSVEVSSNATGKLVNRISDTNASFAWINDGNTEIVTLLNNGNLGIGKVDPNHTLHVEGSLNVTGIATFGNDVTIGTLYVSDIVAFPPPITDVVIDNVNVNTTTGLSTFASINLPSVGIASTAIGIGTITPDYDLDVRGTASVEKLGVSSAFNNDYNAVMQVDGTILASSIGIGTTNTVFGEEGEETEGDTDGLLLEGASLRQRNSEIILESSTIRSDNQGSIGIGTTSPRSAVDFSDAGQGTIPTGLTYSVNTYMIVPRITTAQRTEMIDNASTYPLQESALMWNADLNRFEFYDGTGWNYIQGQAFTPN
tara:strand:- start:7639 stop:9435 length:1797 start_codon:yes stop_codon:yes gene_type:complete